MDSGLYPGAKLEAPSVAPVSFTASPPTPLATSPLAPTSGGQPARRTRTRPSRNWVAGVGALLAINLGLAGANLHLFGLPPFSEIVEMPADALDQAVVSTTVSSGVNIEQHRALGSAPSGPPVAPAVRAEAVEVTEIEAEVSTAPEGPMKVMAAIAQSGELMVAGSVPDEETVGRLLAEAARHLPGGEAQVLADITVHPDASFDPASTRVLLWEPAVFAQGSSVLSEQYTTILNIGIEMLVASPELKVAVTGHASPDGRLTPNLFLSAERVAAVLAYLEAAGVPEEQILTLAAGESDLGAGAGAGGPGRRVEVELINFFGEG